MSVRARSTILLSIVAALIGVAGASAQDFTTEDCLLCHAEADVVDMAELAPRPGLVVDVEGFADSVHADFDCSFCHEGIADIPHEADLPDVDPETCSMCHDVEQWEQSVHGVAWQAGDPDAATCSDCHGIHDIHPTTDPDSRVYPLQLPDTCGQCHADQQMALEHSLRVPDPYHEYVRGIHGRAVLRAGLLVSATCTDCHGAHDVWPEDDDRSKIHVRNIPETCGSCHQGILVEFEESIHGELLEAGEADVPHCATCHSPHEIVPTQGTGFVAQATEECGTCHASYMDTYRGTYHGKVNALGYSDIAACSSCHTPHHILPADNPASTVAPANRLDTCAECHPGANENFAAYIVHADPLDYEANPILFVVYTGMLSLIIVTLLVWTGHTLLWYRRLRQERRERGKGWSTSAFAPDPDEPQVLRFNAFNRLLHIMVMTSFLILVATGIPIRFPETQWAATVVEVFDGFRGAAWWHRVGAILTFAYAFLHLGYVAYLKFGKGYRLFTGPDSIIPDLRDWRELKQNIRWFLGRAERPDFGRWTYFEKFDYLADGWGVFIFGVTGLIMWYPVLFTKILPGWAINVAVILHGFEALLALSFIFTVHFFNAHLRPGKFPADPVFLTGRISLEELKEERPAEYRRYVEEGILEDQMVQPPSAVQLHWAKIIGYTALIVGLVIVGLVAFSVIAVLLG